MKPELLIMAAGVASRYGTLKQIETLGPGGETLMDYAVYDALRAGVERIVFVIRRETETDFHQLVGRRYARRAEVVYAYQDLHDLPGGRTPPAGRTKPWGTGQAVLAAREVLRAPFLVINADDFYGAEAFRLLVEFLDEPAAKPPERYAMVAYELGSTLSDQGTVSRGVCKVSPEGTLEEVIEHVSIARTPEGAVARPVANATTGGESREVRFTGREPVSLNIWAFRPSLFPLLAEAFGRFLDERIDEPGAELYLPSVVAGLIDEGTATVRVFHTASPWFGVTYREDRPIVERRLRELAERGDYPSPLWEP
jgi:choline kinase